VSPTDAGVERVARQAFTALDCAGLLSVSCIVDADVVIDEVRIFPGFSSTSEYPLLWAAAGLDYPDLLDTLIQTALRRAPGSPYGDELGLLA
jgi:D-alanine-D-alanine ligase